MAEDLVHKGSAQTFYKEVLTLLNQSGIPFLVGGAFALQRFTGVKRNTKDLDIFVRPADSQKVLDYFSKEGYRSELIYPHWLGKIIVDAHTVDIIFSSGNGISTVDDDWFRYAVEGEVLDIPIKLTPPEEMIHSKAYVMERERYDGADVAHFIRATAPTLDWNRLVRRFGSHWKLFFSHLLLFEFIYPSDRTLIPSHVMEDFLRRFADEMKTGSATERICFGTFLSREQFLPDLRERGYQDARLSSPRTMSEDDVKSWTDAIANTK